MYGIGLEMLLLPASYCELMCYFVALAWWVYGDLENFSLFQILNIAIHFKKHLNMDW